MRRHAPRLAAALWRAGGGSGTAGEAGLLPVSGAGPRWAATGVGGALRGGGGGGGGVPPLAALASRGRTHPPTRVPVSTASAPPHARFARVSAPAAAAVEVRVAAMGESISEGTIASVVAPPGTAVEEDAVIATIETDKVTIDVRAPSAGIVQQVLVKPDETVVVGQLVAILGDEALEGTPTPPPPAAAEQGASVAAAPAAAAVATAQPAHHTTAVPAGRVPAIRFPPRRTAGGEVISALPAAAQAAARAAVGGGGGMVGGGAGSAGPRPPLSTSSSLPPLSQRLAGLGSSDTKWYAGKERGVKMTATAMSEAEIELIELGGAV